MRQEQLMEQAIYDKFHREEERKQEIAREEALATELARAKLAQMSEDKMRQQVRESSIELRELEAKLKEGYVAKERAAQIMEKQVGCAAIVNVRRFYERTTFDSVSVQ